MQQHREGTGLPSRLPSLLGMNPYDLLAASPFPFMRLIVEDMDP